MLWWWLAVIGMIEISFNCKVPPFDERFGVWDILSVALSISLRFFSSLFFFLASCFLLNFLFHFTLAFSLLFFFFAILYFSFTWILYTFFSSYSGFHSSTPPAVEHTIFPLRDFSFHFHSHCLALRAFTRGKTYSLLLFSPSLNSNSGSDRESYAQPIKSLHRFSSLSRRTAFLLPSVSSLCGTFFTSLPPAAIDKL